ncbi:VOC family protein [Actinopolymorpha alba]|uniref:VOC family protein n=1 Tax=Actinopolymorpha alba TaxID=533267 RepID=UPI0003808772|nr:VOC family protein [Actinopolymorpha alba]
MRETGENYATALAAERSTRPPARGTSSVAERREMSSLDLKSAVATRLRGTWLGVSDMERSREFYELIGASFDSVESSDGIVYCTLAGTRLVFELAPANPNPGAGPYLLFDVTNADALHAELQRAGYVIEKPPENEPWGRQFNVLDPDGYSIAFIGPITEDSFNV